MKLKAAIAEDEREAAQATTKEEKAKLQAEAKVSYLMWMITLLLWKIIRICSSNHCLQKLAKQEKEAEKKERKAERAERIFLAEETQKKKNLEAKFAAARAVS